MDQRLLQRLGAQGDLLGRFTRSEAQTLGEIWEQSARAGDLAWLAARVASQPIDCAKTARAFVTGIELAAGGANDACKGALANGAALVDALLVSPDEVRAVAGELRSVVTAARGALVAVERSLKGRAIAGANAERAVHAALEGAHLVLVGGWRAKAAERALAGFEEAEKLLGERGQDLHVWLRTEIPFVEFDTGWWSAQAAGAPDTL